MVHLPPKYWPGKESRSLNPTEYTVCGSRIRPVDGSHYWDDCKVMLNVRLKTNLYHYSQFRVIDSWEFQLFTEIYTDCISRQGTHGSRQTVRVSVECCTPTPWRVMSDHIQVPCMPKNSQHAIAEETTTSGMAKSVLQPAHPRPSRWAFGRTIR